MNKQILGLAVMVVGLGIATAAALWKTKTEVQSSWKNDSSTRWVEETSAHNPSLWLADPRDIASERDPVRPIREPVAHPGDSDLQATWRSDADMTWTTRSGPNESGEVFADRAGQDFSSMLKVFPKR